MKVVAALVPFLGMFLVGVVVLRAILFGDRREREAMKRLEALDAAGQLGSSPLAPAPKRAAANDAAPSRPAPNDAARSTDGQRVDVRNSDDAGR